MIIMSVDIVSINQVVSFLDKYEVKEKP